MQKHREVQFDDMNHGDAYVVEMQDGAEFNLFFTDFHRMVYEPHPNQESESYHLRGIEEQTPTKAERAIFLRTSEIRRVWSVRRLTGT